MALLSIAEASKEVGCHPNSIRNWIRGGAVHAYRIHSGGKIYVKDKEIMRIARKMQHNPRTLFSDELSEDEI